MAAVAEGGDLTDLTNLGKLINTEIDKDLVQQLMQVDNLNVLLLCDFLEDEELIPVGSSVDGSKITFPGDSGDVDVLIIPNKIILKETLFDYDMERPAFLHIRVNEDHEKYFKTVKDPINGIYLPITVLKELKEKIFFLSKLFLNVKVQQGISKDGKYLNVTRTSAVGKEQVQLCPDDESVLFSMGIENGMEFSLKRMEIFFRYSLVEIMNADFEGKNNMEMQAARRNDLLQEHENMSLSDLLNKFLNHAKKSGKGESSVCDNNEGNRGRQPHGAGDENSTSNTHKEEQNNSKENQRDVIYKRKLSQDCTPLKVSKIKDNYSELNEDCDTGGVKSNASFSIAKSTDYVPAFKFDGWPRVADEWLARSRIWPSKDTLKKVLKAGCQVVAKRPLVLCNTQMPGEKDPYFRLSFALVEIHLAKTMTDQQLLCWRILKVYQKCYLQTRPKFLTSYHWKNILFWVSESTEESVWTNEDVSQAVLRCLDFMSDCLQKRHLPFYFVRKMNMFEGCDINLFESLRRRVEEIRCSPIEFLKRSISEPPTSQIYFIDKGEIVDMLSEEERAKKIDTMMEELMDVFISKFPSFLEGNNAQSSIKQTQEVMIQMIKTIGSENRESSSDNTHNSDEFISKFEGIAEAFKTENGAEIYRSIDDLIQSSKDTVIRLITKDAEPENAKRDKTLNTLDCLRSAFAELLTRDDRPSAKFTSMHQFSTLIQENFENESDKTDGDTKGKQMFSAILGGFPKFVEALKDEQVNNKESFPENFRQIVNEISEKVKNISEKEKKPERKYNMDLDLD